MATDSRDLPGCLTLVALCAAISGLALFALGCGGSHRPAAYGLAVAYEAAIETWRFADDWTAGACRVRAQIAEAAIERSADEIVAQCPAVVEPSECLIGAYRSLVGSCYAAAERLERVREALALWHEATAAGDERGAREYAGIAAEALLVIADELRADGVRLRPELEQALRVLALWGSR